MTTPTLTDNLERLIRAEQILAVHLPNMRTIERVALLQEIQAVMEGRA